MQGTGHWHGVRECLNMAKVDAVPKLQEFMLPSDVAHRWLAAHSRGNRTAASTKWRTAHAAFKSSRGITPFQTADLPGVLREHLIADGKAREAELTLDDLAGGFWIGNALRGLMRAVLV